MDIKDIKMSDIKRIKAIRMRCPYCGEWHSLSKTSPKDVFAMKCDIWPKEPELSLEFREEESQILVKLQMDYPCKYVEEFKSTNLIKLSEFEQEGNQLSKTINLAGIVDAIKADYFLKNLRISYDSGKAENIAESCWLKILDNDICQKCNMKNYKETLYDMRFPMEIIMEFEESPEMKQEEEKMEENIKMEEKMEEKTVEKMVENKKMAAMPMLPVDINQMAKDFGINFGLNTDERIQSTILGTVVEYDKGKFRGFDRDEKVMTDYSNLATISLPSVLIPSTTVKVGDTIIHSGEPFFILKAKEGAVWGANPLTSKEEKLLPIANPLGIKTYTRLITVGEILGFKGNNPQNTKVFFWLLTMVASKVFYEGVDSANDKIREATSKGSKYFDIIAPFAFVAFAAYAMKGDDMRMNDLAKTAKDNFGIEFDCLKDKKVLKRIAAIGLATTATVTYFNSTMKKAASEGADEYNKEEVTQGLDKLLKAIKPWKSTIQKVLPAAIAICAVKLFNSSTLEGIKEKAEGCVLIAQDKFCDKLGVSEDFFNKENLKKFGLLVGIAITTFMVYGKRLELKDKNSETAAGMVKQIIPVIAPLIPAIIIFAPNLKSFFAKYNKNETKEPARITVEVNAEDVESGEEPENQEEESEIQEESEKSEEPEASEEDSDSDETEK